jgi:hypothetical protein
MVLTVLFEAFVFYRKGRKGGAKKRRVADLLTFFPADDHCA